jgi:hypothetical protein
MWRKSILLARHRHQLRAMSGKAGVEFVSPIPVDVEHFTSGWNITDIGKCVAVLIPQSETTNAHDPLCS